MQAAAGLTATAVEATTGGRVALLGCYLSGHKRHGVHLTEGASLQMEVGNE